MTYTVIVSHKAKNDFAEAVLDLIERAPAKASKFYFGGIKAMESLSASPARCPLAPESKVINRRVRQLLYDQYRILFEIEGDTVIVDHLRHQKRGPITADDL